MKRFAPFITCFYLCSLFLPLSLRANVLPISETTVTGAAADDYYKSSRAQLKVLSNNKVGQTLVASEALSSTAALSGLVTGAAGLAGVAYYERTGKDPVYAAFNAVASAADALFVPAYQAFKANFVSPESYPATASQYVGVEGSVGAKLGDIIDFVKKSSEGAYASLKSLITDNTNQAYDPVKSTTAPVAGTFIGDDGLGYNVSEWEYAGIFYANDLTSLFAGYISNAMILNSVRGYIFHSGRLYTWCFNYKTSDNRYAWYMYRSLSVTTFDPENPPASPGSINYDALKSALNKANMDAAIANDIRNAVQNLPTNQKITSNDPSPSSVPANGPSPITNNQVTNFFAQNTTNIYNQSLETITDNSTSTSTVTNDVAKAAAEAAKAQEEEAEKQTEETFNPISDSAFAEPYNPGEFDIPARFTTFLNNVKSSGLFSFSNNFFNSLPSGGSPIFEIEGGIFGSHSIDLSETMSGGLAVVKTVLLALFGFLSIRAVIMKR